MFSQLILRLSPFHFAAATASPVQDEYQSVTENHASPTLPPNTIVSLSDLAEFLEIETTITDWMKGSKTFKLR